MSVSKSEAREARRFKRAQERYRGEGNWRIRSWKKHRATQWKVR